MKLTAEMEKKLPDSVFGLPEERKYPMPDREHAANAKARAKQMLDKGELTQSQYDQIIAKADKILSRQDDKQRYDACSLKKAKIDEDGFLHDTAVLTRTGVFKYINSDGSIRREYRPPEEVMAPMSLETYRGVPITVGHPANGVSAQNARQVTIGSVLSPGIPDGNNILGDIVIYDPKALGDNRELSCGYRLDLEDSPGTDPVSGEPYDYIQRNIRMNHLSVVRSARAGNQARLNIDGNEEFEGGKQMKLGNVEFNVSAEAEAEINKIIQRADAAESKTKEVQATADKEQARADALQAKADGHAAEVEQARKDAIESEKERINVVAKAKTLNVDAKDEMSIKDLKVAVIKAVRKDFDETGKSDDYINAAYEFASDGMAQQRQAVYNHDGKQQDFEAGSSAKKRQDMIEEMKNAYKEEKK